jgi:hypothetical protein
MTGASCLNFRPIVGVFVLLSPGGEISLVRGETLVIGEEVIEFSEGDASFTNSFKVSSTLGASVIGIGIAGSSGGAIADSVLVSKVLGVDGDGAEADFGNRGDTAFDISGELLLGTMVSGFSSGFTICAQDALDCAGIVRDGTGDFEIDLFTLCLGDCAVVSVNLPSPQLLSEFQVSLFVSASRLSLGISILPVVAELLPKLSLT